jgi:tubby and related proteins
MWSKGNKNIKILDRGCYLLDYKERNIKQSVKNFQLIQSNKMNIDTALNDEVLLQFARTSENSFILDFKFPFSPQQAVSIALSSIDNKIACE